MERRWEELDVNCLAHIFARLCLEDMILSIPFVCKAWSRASLDPLCWRSLKFSLNFWSFGAFAGRFHRQYPGTFFSFSGLLKLALRRSQGSVTELILPREGYSIDDDDICQEDLHLVENECPEIKFFGYSRMDRELQGHIPKMIAKWKNLEGLWVMSSVFYFEETLAEIKQHCVNFGRLLITDMNVTERESNAIATLLPSLKYLFLIRGSIDKRGLMAVLDGCKELVELRIKKCSGFVPDDEIMKRAAAIQTFLYESPTYDDEEDYCPSLCMSDVYDGNSDDGYEL